MISLIYLYEIFNCGGIKKTDEENEGLPYNSAIFPG